MKLTKPKCLPTSPTRHPDPAGDHAFARFDQPVAENTRASGLTLEEQLRSVRLRLLGRIPGEREINQRLQQEGL